MKTPSIQRVIAQTTLLLSVAYIAIETQSLLMLWDVIQTNVPEATLAKYERFGYAGTGIGITLLVFRWLTTPSRKIKPIQLLLICAMVPVIYSVSVWTAYESVTRAPKLIPQESRPSALYFSMKMLNEPSLKAASGFWLNSAQSGDFDSLSSTFNETHPAPKQLIQKTYVEGIKTVPLISQLFELKHNYLTSEQYKKLHRSSSLFAFSKNNYKARYENALLEVLKYNEASWGFFTVSPGTMSVIASKYRLDTVSIANLTAASLDMSLTGKYPRFKPASERMRYVVNHYIHAFDGEINNEIRLAKWSAMKEALPFLHGDAPAIENFELAVRKQFTDDSFGMLVEGANLTPLPWYTGQRASNTPTYGELLWHLTPFFYDSNGSALFNFSQLSDSRMQINLRSSILRGVSDDVRNFYSNYRVRTLSELARDPSAWGNYVNNITFEPMLRFSVIIPLLFILSGTLLAANLAMTFKDNKLTFALALAISCSVVALHGGVTTEIMLDLLLNISVKEAAIVLF